MMTDTLTMTFTVTDEGSVWVMGTETATVPISAMVIVMTIYGNDYGWNLCVSHTGAHARRGAV